MRYIICDRICITDMCKESCNDLVVSDKSGYDSALLKANVSLRKLHIQQVVVSTTQYTPFSGLYLASGRSLKELKKKKIHCVVAPRLMIMLFFKSVVISLFMKNDSDDFGPTWQLKCNRHTSLEVVRMFVLFIPARVSSHKNTLLNQIITNNNH